MATTWWVCRSEARPANAKAGRRRLYDCFLVPRKGLEPPRCYSLVPETSASTNSATWAFQERKGFYIKNNIEHIGTGLLDEIEGVIQGHRDGHGYVLRDDGDSDIYLPPNEMRAVLH